LLKWIVK